MPSAERTCRALIEAGVSVRRAARAAGVSPRQLRRYREHWPAPSPATRAARAEQRLIEAEAAHRGGCQRWKPGRPYDALRDLALIALADTRPCRLVTVDEAARLIGRHRTTVHRWFRYDPQARALIDGARAVRRANRELLRALADLYGLPVATVADRLLHGDAPGGESLPP